MNKINPRPVVLVAMILAVGFFRIATTSTHSTLSGFTPLGAMALFGGFYFNDKWKAYLFPLLTLWLSDIFINRYVFFGYWVFFYSSFAWVYSGFALIVWIGQMIKKLTAMNLTIASVVAAFVHWLVSNFGVWLVGCTGTTSDTSFAPTIQGLISCYAMGVLSMGNFLIGNLVFCALLFGTFELMQRKFSFLKYQP